MESPVFHDYEIDDGNRTIRFMLAQRNGGEAGRSIELVFRDVEGYLLRRAAGTGPTLAVEEQPLTEFLDRNEAYFAREARWGWPRFWRGSAQGTAAWLASRGRRAWAVSASYDLSGWIVAGNASYHNGP